MNESAPNLAKFITTSAHNEKIAASKIRPDSSMSISSTATTSYSHSISEADSGVDFETPSKKIMGVATKLESLPKLDARKGVGLRATPMDTPSKRTKRTDSSKLLRAVSK